MVQNFHSSTISPIPSPFSDGCGASTRQRINTSLFPPAYASPSYYHRNQEQLGFLESYDNYNGNGLEAAADRAACTFSFPANFGAGRNSSEALGEARPQSG
eukprot:3647552-Rhodomonas_salina.1